MKSLELHAISLGYKLPEGRFIQVASSLSFTVASGEICCLAGRSGSGKTTLLSIAAGLLTPDKGQVWWFGQPVSAMNDEQRASFRRTRLGYLDQGAKLLEGLTTLENVLVPAVPSKQTKKLRSRAMSLLERLELGGRLRQPPARLSGGERQRVALARAMLMSPSLLVVDEPTSSLDRATADAVIKLLQEEASAGAALLVASHDSKMIDASTRVVRLELETTAMEGSP